MKKSVKIAYWDTEQGAATPPLLGQIQGTPTIKFIKPSKKNKKGKYNKKTVLDYNGGREVGPMKEFAEAHMPTSVEKINGKADLQKFHDKAAKFGLPRVLVFTKKSSPVVKALSTEFRRKLLVGEIKGTKNNAALLEEYGIKDLPAVIVLKDDDNHVVFDKKPSYNALNFFLAKHALKKPVDGPVKVEKEEAAKEDIPEKKEL